MVSGRVHASPLRRQEDALERVRAADARPWLPRDVRDDAAAVVEVPVPVGERDLDLRDVGAAVGEPDRLPASGRTRYWYQVISHANVSTSSLLTPESGTIETSGAPSALATPSIVRRKRLALKRSAASTSAASESESRRRTGSGTDRLRPRRSPTPRSCAQRGRFRRACGDSAREIGPPSRTQPYSSATSWQSGHTSTNSTPSGENRTVYSPWSSVRSQTAHARRTVDFVTRIARTLAGIFRYPHGGRDRRVRPTPYAFAASRSRLVSSITFCATCDGTSS